jgi:hypothetical protein
VCGFSTGGLTDDMTMGTQRVACACLWLATKLEESPRKLRDVLNVFLRMECRREGLPLEVRCSRVTMVVYCTQLRAHFSSTAACAGSGYIRVVLRVGRGVAKPLTHTHAHTQIVREAHLLRCGSPRRG